MTESTESHKNNQLLEILNYLLHGFAFEHAIFFSKIFANGLKF